MISRSAISSNLKKITLIQRASGWSLLRVVGDVGLSFLVLGASPANYYNFGFYRLPYKYRRLYITNRINRKLIRKLNSPNSISMLEDKGLFSEVFKSYVKREVVRIPDCGYDEFKKFVSRKDKFVYKPTWGSQGKGVQVIEVTDPRVVFETLAAAGEGVLEEYVKQHGSLDEIYDRALSVLRIVTLKRGEHVDILYALITFGLTEDIANLSFNGICGVVNLQTGFVSESAVDTYGETHQVHPRSGVSFSSIRVPRFQEALDMARNAARVIDGIGYVGWDVAVTDSGPVLIEGNTSTGYSTYQNLVFCGQVVPLRFVLDNHLARRSI